MRSSPELEKYLNNYRSDILAFKNKYQKHVCDEEKLNSSMIRLKKILLENIKDTPEARACQSFKI